MRRTRAAGRRLSWPACAPPGYRVTDPAASPRTELVVPVHAPIATRLTASPILKTSLIPVRLERTREVLRELLRSVKEALPILAGVAGPLFVASFALLAWAGVPPMLAVTLPWRDGLALWLAQAAIGGWPLWALRARLLPAAWCVQLRCLPLKARALWLSDIAVSAAVLAPLGVLYLVSAAVFAWQRPHWWTQAMPLALVSLAASWTASCGIGAAALAWQRRGPTRRASLAPADTSLARRPGSFAALLWWPGWRGALTPGFGPLIAGVAAAAGLALAWTLGPWPVVPGAAWALMLSVLLIALTERLQRAMEQHLDALAPWLSTLPLSASWRWRGRALVCVPMLLGGAIVVLLVVATRPWRAWPLAAFALGLVATPLALNSVPSANREGHVALWALSAGLLTAFGSELWN
jgi:hypothetical protein